MAPQTTTQLNERIAIGIEAVQAHIADLPGLASDWAELESHVQASESLEWAHLMADYLTELDAQYRSGQMTSDQQARYREVLRQLKEALPIIKQLNLYRPPVPLEA